MQHPKITVCLSIEIDVTLPIEAHADDVEADLDPKWKEAAIEAALGSMPQNCEVDVSSPLGIQFHTTGPACSLARVFNQATDNDVTDVRMTDLE